MALTLQEIRDKLKQQNMKSKEQIPEPKVEFEKFKAWNLLKKRPYEISTPYVDGSILTCPICDDGESYLHHLGVDLYSGKEDNVNKHTAIYEPESHGWGVINSYAPENTVDTNTIGNPSERRTGIVITFVCETCGGLHRLGFGQHQGRTQMRWLD